MSRYINAKLVSAITAFAVGALYLDRQVTSLADRSVVPAAPLLADQIQIGVIPAGCVLVPQLSTVQVARFDTNGTSLGKYKIGTADTIDAIATEQIGAAAVTVRGNALVIGATPIGSPTDDTPIYLTVSVAPATFAGTGAVVLDLVMRAWVDSVDGT